MESYNQILDYLNTRPEMVSLRGVTNQVIGMVIGFLPRLLGAVALMLIGKWAAQTLANLSNKLESLLKINKGAVKKPAFLEKIGLKMDLQKVIKQAIYWTVYLIFLSAAADILGLSVVRETLESLIAYIPNVLAVIVVLVLSSMAGKFVRHLLKESLKQTELEYAESLGSIAEGVILFFGITLAASQLGLDISVITTNLSIIIGGIVALLVLAGGLGSKEIVANLLAGYLVKNQLKKGEEVTLIGQKGRIAKIGKAAITLENERGKFIIPHQKVISQGSLK